MNPDEIHSRSSTLNSFLGRHLEIRDQSGSGSGRDPKVRQGVLLAADPITSSLVLVSKVKDKTCVQVLPHFSAISDIREIKTQDTEGLQEVAAKFLQENKVSKEPEVVLKRKESLKKFLVNGNQLEVVEEADGTLVVQDLVSIAPPYAVGDCEGTNEIILERVCALIRQFEC